MSLSAIVASSLGFGLRAALVKLRNEAQAAFDAIPGKAPVRVASNASIANLSSVLLTDFDGTAQGVTLVAGDRVGVINTASLDGIEGAAAKREGIYVVGTPVAGRAPFTRALDADVSGEVMSGMSFRVTEGTFAGKAFALTTANPIVLDTTALAFSQVATTATDATTLAKGILQLAGDLAGTAALPVVAQVNGTSVPATPGAGSALIPSSGTVALWRLLDVAGGAAALVNWLGFTPRARGVCTTNMSTAAFVGVAGGTPQDGVTYAQGQVVLFAGQTSVGQNGPWVVGLVAAGTAPLARPWWWPTGGAIPNGVVFEVAEGTLWKNSSWKVTGTGALVIDTGDPLLFPKTYKQTVTLSAGTYTIGVGGGAEALYLLAGASVQASQNTHAGTLGTSRIEAPSASRITGKAGTAAIVINSLVDAGTVAGSDTSTVDVLATNW